MRLSLATLLAVSLCAVPGIAAAASLSGMGANLYGNYFNFPKPNLEKHPVDKITAGKLAVTLQRTRLKDVQKVFGGTIQQDGGATWLCYHTADANSWFISNALGGEEFVMIVAVEAATSKVPGDCEAASEAFVTPVFDVPGLGATTAELKAHFGKISGGSKVSFRADQPGGYSDVAQYLGYVLRSGKVVGMGVGETSVPTTH